MVLSVLRGQDTADVILRLGAISDDSKLEVISSAWGMLLDAQKLRHERVDAAAPATLIALAAQILKSSRGLAQRGAVASTFVELMACSRAFSICEVKARGATEASYMTDAGTSLSCGRRHSSG